MVKQPKNPFHPGEILLEEFLQPQGLSQAEFARKIGWTKARLNELIRGKRWLYYRFNCLWLRCPVAKKTGELIHGRIWILELTFLRDNTGRWINADAT